MLISPIVGRNQISEVAKTMPGSQPKEGIAFELLVAAELKTSEQDTSSGKLNLTDYAFNSNPVSYLAKMTGAPFDVTVDIVATNAKTFFFVECKSSKDPDAIMKPRTGQFLDAMLEFLALEMHHETSNWDMRFILAVNYPLGKGFQSFIDQRDDRKVGEFAGWIARRAEESSGRKLSKEFLSSKRINKVLGELIILSLNERYLRSRLTNDARFQDAFNEFGKGLRTPQKVAIAASGGSLVEGFQSVVIECNSDSHENCADVTSGGVACHFGNGLTILGRIIQRAQSNLSNSVETMTSRDCGFNPIDVHWSASLSSETAARSLTACLNKLLRESGKKDFLVFVVPGLFDLLILNPRTMGPALKESHSSSTMKYQLDMIAGLSGLGYTLKTEIARYVLKEVYGVEVPWEGFDSQED
jgi:hypothetical protein